jgi:adenine deaminase
MGVMRHSKANYGGGDRLKRQIMAARGKMPVDLLVENVRYLDVFTGQFVSGKVAVHDQFIVGIDEDYEAKEVIDGQGRYLVPGFIDSHVHLESSMMIPQRFEEAVLPCGTTSVVWDPHEIANVWGQEGIRWAIEASEGLLLDVFIMAPSCVPSTSPVMGFETSGAELLAEHLKEFVNHPRVLGLAEMMNFPGLLSGDDDIMAKLSMFAGGPRDGHCPGLSGKDLNAYGTAGICSCHESTTLEEAKEKLRKGIHVWIREGSCAKDADKLLPLINPYTSATAGLCSDDRNPLDIAEDGHINRIIDIALSQGIAPEDIFRTASFGPARNYQLMDRGAIAPGYLADMVLCQPKAGKWLNGVQIDRVFKKGRCSQRYLQDIEIRPDHSQAASSPRKNMHMPDPSPQQLRIDVSAERVKASVIGVRPGQIVTDHLRFDMEATSTGLQSDLSRDILKIAVFERHHNSGNVSVGFVHGFGLKRGAIATTVNHDSHNVIAVGASDEAIVAAVAELKRMDGGIVVYAGPGHIQSLALPIGGLMTGESPAFIAERLKTLKSLANEIGCKLEEPFLTLSFLALPVIPSLKITDRGLVDVDQFRLVTVASFAGQ